MPSVDTIDRFANANHPDPNFAAGISSGLIREFEDQAMRDSIQTHGNVPNLKVGVSLGADGTDLTTGKTINSRTGLLEGGSQYGNLAAPLSRAKEQQYQAEFSELFGFLQRATEGGAPLEIREVAKVAAYLTQHREFITNNAKVNRGSRWHEQQTKKTEHTLNLPTVLRANGRPRKRSSRAGRKSIGRGTSDEKVWRRWSEQV